MKKTFLLFASLLFTVFYTNAGILTVNNNPDSPAQFTVAQDAVDAAQPGDTILFAGSNTSYGNFTITKPLTIIGTGYKPQNQFDLVANFSTIYFGSEADGFGNVVNNGSGTKIIGVNAGGIYLTSSILISNVLIQRCKLGNIPMSEDKARDIIIENNIITSYISPGNNENILIRNNIIQGYVGTSNKSSVVITNNVFHRGGSDQALNNVSYAIVTNNIFYGAPPAGCTYTTFNNNISFTGGANEFIYDTNTGGSNLEAVDPKFMHLEVIAGFSFDNDYTLAAGSPAIGAGTDGTDIGISGGSMPFDQENNKVSQIPQILQMDVLNSSIPVDGTLNVKVNATIHN